MFNALNTYKVVGFEKKTIISSSGERKKGVFYLRLKYGIPKLKRKQSEEKLSEEKEEEEEAEEKQEILEERR